MTLSLERHSETSPAVMRMFGVSGRSAFPTDPFGVVFVVPAFEAAKRSASVLSVAILLIATGAHRANLNTVHLSSGSTRLLFSIPVETPQIQRRGFPQ